MNRNKYNSKLISAETKLLATEFKTIVHNVDFMQKIMFQQRKILWMTKEINKRHGLGLDCDFNIPGITGNRKIEYKTIVQEFKVGLN